MKDKDQNKNMKRYGAGKGFCMINFKFAGHIGANNAVYLGFLISELDNVLDNTPGELVDGFFPMTRNYIEEKTLMTEKQQRTAKEKLAELGFIEVKNGSSKYRMNQNWFKINMDAIMKIVDEINTQKGDMILPKGATLTCPEGQHDTAQKGDSLYSTRTNTIPTYDSSFPKEQKGGRSKQPSRPFLSKTLAGNSHSQVDLNDHELSVEDRLSQQEVKGVEASHEEPIIPGYEEHHPALVPDDRDNDRFDMMKALEEIVATVNQPS
ncbi:MAG: hypothetical protein WC799_05485 [Desulfobacteraceae bacterium]